MYTHANRAKQKRTLAKRSMLRASQWKPAKVMNCQQKPNLALGAEGCCPVADSEKNPDGPSRQGLYCFLAIVVQVLPRI